MLAYAALANCQLCARHCGVNRLAGERGLCHAGPQPRVFSAQVEVSDELELIPVFAIAFSGCDLRCDFCITGKQSWNPTEGDVHSLQALAQRARSALAQGARSIMILGGEPTVHLPTALELVSCLPDDAQLIWKTNAHASAEARTILEGIFDVWVADYKFGNDACAERLAKVRNYTPIVQENLLWAAGQTHLIVRHLLMPGHVDCCWARVAEWLAQELPGVEVNLRFGFWPGWRSARHSELSFPMTEDERDRARTVARRNNLHLVD
jgi:putative pyruvate formate lyase activating enzyme